MQAEKKQNCVRDKHHHFSGGEENQKEVLYSEGKKKEGNLEKGGGATNVGEGKNYV